MTNRRLRRQMTLCKEASDKYEVLVGYVAEKVDKFINTSIREEYKTNVMGLGYDFVDFRRDTKENIIAKTVMGMLRDKRRENINAKERPTE